MSVHGPLGGSSLLVPLLLLPLDVDAPVVDPDDVDEPEVDDDVDVLGPSPFVVVVQAERRTSASACVDFIPARVPC